MIVVFYDPATGRILNTAQGAPSIIAADPRPFIEVEEVRDDYDVTHHVINGTLVPIGEDT